jgi:rhodanese-related sulfurtransferase
VKSVSPADAAQLLAAGALLVDVRGEALTAHGGPSAPRVAAVPYAFLVDGALTHNADFADGVAYAAGAAPIVLCDSAGVHAQQAGRELAAKTRNEVYVLEGGFQAWVVRCTVRIPYASTLADRPPARTRRRRSSRWWATRRRR